MSKAGVPQHRWYFHRPFLSTRTHMGFFSHPVRYSGPRRRQSYTTLLSHFRDSRQRGKHTKASHTRTHTQSVETGLFYCFSSMNRHFPFLRSLFAIFIVSPWRHAGPPCFLFDYSTRCLVESKSMIENFQESDKLNFISNLRIFWNKRFRFVSEQHSFACL